MKKFLMILIGLLIISAAFFIFFNVKHKQEEPKILSELDVIRNINGEIEFLFSITNVGGNDATLDFPTWLEYNVSIDNLDNKEIHSGEIIKEHLDLNENNKVGRKVILEPDQKIEYRLLISKIPIGNYEIIFSSASGYGGIHSEEFIIEY